MEKEGNPTLCNLCGKQFDIYDEYNGYEFASPIGYGSKYDTMQFSMHICLSCMDKLIDRCKISPFVKDRFLEVV